MNFTTTAPDRKTLVKALAAHLELDANYNGPPTFSYSIGAATVDRNGTVMTEDESLATRIKGFLIGNGWMEPEAEPKPEPAAEPEDDSQAQPETAAEEETDEATMNIGVPITGWTVPMLTNLIHTLYSKQYLLGRATGAECIRIADAVITRLQEYTPETVEDYRSLLDDFKALGDLKGITLTAESVSIAFPQSEDDQTRSTYQLLALRILQAAQAAKRVRPDYQKPEAEKYTMRGWLLRLGFGGPQHQIDRKLLLQNLKGCSAFPNAEQAKRHAEKYAAIRREQRQASREEAQTPAAEPAPIEEGPVLAHPTDRKEVPVDAK
ncbi:MAG: hypothetical protein IJ313_02940 [Clostridia bacterium]|nr:hypothetical protein [Clostridia bacterium]